MIIDNDNYQIVREIHIACDFLITLNHLDQFFATKRKNRDLMNEHVQLSKKLLLDVQIIVDFELTSTRFSMSRLSDIVDRRSKKSFDKLEIRVKSMSQSIVDYV